MAALLAALAVLLGFAAARELLAGHLGQQATAGGRGGSSENAASSPMATGSKTAERAGTVSALPRALRGRSARAALRLGLPERLRRSGLAPRLSLGTVLLAKLASAVVGGLAALAASRQHVCGR